MFCFCCAQETFVCLVINDQHISVLKPTADDYFRWDLQGSFAGATSCANEFWWKGGSECPFGSDRLLGDAAEGQQDAVLDSASAEALLERSRMLNESAPSAAPATDAQCDDMMSPASESDAAPPACQSEGWRCGLRTAAADTAALAG